MMIWYIAGVQVVSNGSIGEVRGKLRRSQEIMDNDKKRKK